MRAHSTRDVSLEILREFGEDLGSDFDLEVDDSQTMLLSEGPPSWIHLIAQSEWWLNGLAVASALYVAELIKESAKETWKNKAKVAAAFVGVTNKVRTFAEKIIKLRQRLPERTAVVLALPVPHDYFGSMLALSARDADTLTVEIALFVHHLPALGKLMREADLEGSRTATGLFLVLLDNGDLKVSWVDRDSMEVQSRVILLCGHDAK